MAAQRVDGFHAHAVQSDTFLEGFRVVFAAGVEHVDRLDEFSLRYASSVVAHAHAQVVGDVYLNAFSGVHLKLVDGVVDHLLEQHVDAVFGQ